MGRRLGVNIDHVATLRQARGSKYPDPVHAAFVAECAGAEQITCHIRCDRRHVNERDIRLLVATVTTDLNVECAATDEMIALMEELKPHRVTLVPERPDEVTTEGGLDVAGHRAEISNAVGRLVNAGICVALFIDPDLQQVEAAGMEGVDMIELNTANYSEGNCAKEIERLGKAAALAASLGIEVAAGHGLTHLNLRELVESIPEIIEYNIGHSIISRSIFVGLDRAVGELVEIIN
jgi:pyridoxine 5-phosphate synthase